MRSTAEPAMPAEPGDVVDVLLGQHEQVKQTLAAVEQATGTAKQQAFDDLCALLELHEEAEQRVVHPMTRADVNGGRQVAQTVIAEEREADRQLAELRQLGTADPRFDRAFAAFRDAVLAHAQHEENEEFPKLRQELPPDLLAKMATDVGYLQGR